MLALEIAVGMWLGSMMIAATTWVIITVCEQINKAERYGRPWWKWYPG